ncbi:hypothetical protein C1T17_16420 [Sphingobium sp. SCG-1]|uniref:hypothetical protein n=1 Tax=Sphingobium sp. SCG-1 TaxID=2072936 RepID=UPI000CD6A737|nr:hypothetical protein [Sphingobium sp. SCG-1]AUW59436.1 hypothetical protein C1T17_16420 [Sphingobium sp. SCG-1]
MSLTIVVTNAGRAALVNAANTGTAPVTIASCGISATAVVPGAGATALPGEIKRISTLSGDVVADDTIHLIVRDAGADVFTLRSFALYLADGTLFAIYGQAAVILEKSAQSQMLLALDVRFADVAASSLTFGNTNFLNPPATTEQIGVVELATAAELLAGIDTERVPASKTIKDAVFAWLDARFGANNSGIWHPANDGAGSGLDADLLDGQQGSYYSNIPARLGFTPANKAGETFTGLVSAPTFNLTGISNFGIFSSGGNPIINFDVNDYEYFDRGGNSYQWVIGGVARGSLGSDGYWNGAGFRAGGNSAWHAGNDGAGSGLDADMVDGRHASDFMILAGDETVSGRKTLKANRTGNFGMSTGTGGLGEVEVQGNGVGAAMMTFHRPGSFAAYFGLDMDNAWRVGGWSMGAQTFRLWHEGNDGSGSGLDADLLDGQDSSFFTNIPARLGYEPARRSGDVFYGDITTYRTGATNTGVIFLGSGTGKYLYFDGGSYQMPGAEMFLNSGRVWHSNNDGSGSGLDADLLDGYHASSFDPIVAINLSSNGYIAFASGRKETWGTLTIGQDQYATYNLPVGHSSWVHPTFGLSSQGGNTQIQQNTGITSINGAPPSSITFWNADDRVVTIWVRTIGV